VPHLNILVLSGDHIGPEITAAALEIVMEARRLIGLPLEFRHAEIGHASLQRTGHAIPDSVVDAARSADGVILGPCDTYGYPPVDQGGVNPSSRLRVSLDLYANIRPSRTIAGVPALATRMDLVIVRENTEGFYADRNMFAGAGEFMPTPDIALAVRKVTAHASRRIARVACEQAMQRRKKLSLVSKANVLKLSDGLFLREAKSVAAEYPELAVDHVLVDAMASHLIRSPQAFDVIVTTNMFGDILSNEAAELCGGLGLAGSLNAGDRHAIAQATHGSAPDIAGQDRANPCALIFSVAMLFDWLGKRHRSDALTHAATLIDRATLDVLADPARRTRDLGGSLGTHAFANEVRERLADLAA